MRAAWTRPRISIGVEHDEHGDPLFQVGDDVVGTVRQVKAFIARYEGSVGGVGLKFKIDPSAFTRAVEEATSAAKRLRQALDAIEDAEIGISVVEVRR